MLGSGGGAVSCVPYAGARTRMRHKALPARWADAWSHGRSGKGWPVTPARPRAADKDKASQGVRALPGQNLLPGTPPHLCLPGERLASFRRMSFSSFRSFSLSSSGFGGRGGSFVGDCVRAHARRFLLSSCGAKTDQKRDGRWRNRKSREEVTAGEPRCESRRVQYVRAVLTSRCRQISQQRKRTSETLT